MAPLAALPARAAFGARRSRSLASSRRGGSHASCEALHVLAAQLGLDVLHEFHIHFEPGQEAVGNEYPRPGPEPRLSRRF